MRGQANEGLRIFEVNVEEVTQEPLVWQRDLE
jgi:hypothetical protein